MPRLIIEQIGRAVLIITAAVCMATIVSCGDDAVTHSQVNPLYRVGSVWTYEVTDWTHLDISQRPLRFEVTVRVLDPGPASVAPKPRAIWQISHQGTVDTSFVYVSGDSISIVPTGLRNLKETGEMYLFPLSVGKQWSGDECCADTSRVTAADTLTVPAGWFAAYRIDRSKVVGPDQWTPSITWIDPDAGIVYQVIWGYPLGHKDWLLKDCYLPRSGANPRAITTGNPRRSWLPTGP